MYRLAQCTSSQTDADKRTDGQTDSIRERIHFKIALLTFKSIHIDLPTYLSDLLQFRTSSRHLRSSDHCLLHDAGARTVFAAVARSVMLLR